MEDDTQSRSTRPPDLASIVLESARDQASGRRRRQSDPLDLLLEDRDAWSSAGSDARSVLVLALVVAGLAMVVVWTTTSLRSDPSPRILGAPSGPTANAGTTAAAPKVPAPNQATVATGTGKFSAPAPNLLVGRVVVTRDSGGKARLSVAVVNSGTAALAEASGVEVLMLLNGQVAGTSVIENIAANGGRSTVNVPMTYCTSGRYAVTAVVDPGARVRELDERDNASSSTVEIAC